MKGIKYYPRLPISFYEQNGANLSKKRSEGVLGEPRQKAEGQKWWVKHSSGVEFIEIEVFLCLKMKLKMKILRRWCNVAKKIFADVLESIEQ